MATLTRVHPTSVLDIQGELLLDSRVPQPFPIDILRRRRDRTTARERTRTDEEALLQDLADEELEYDPFSDSGHVGAGGDDEVDDDQRKVRLAIFLFGRVGVDG